jgi:hypothetical protein
MVRIVTGAKETRLEPYFRAYLHVSQILNQQHKTTTGNSEVTARSTSLFCDLQSLCTRKDIKCLWLSKIGYEKRQWQGVSVVRNAILLDTWNPLCTGSKRRHSLLMELPLYSLRYKSWSLLSVAS